MEGTTTVSTIAVQSGQTRIVIALLQVSEWLELKVLEVTPDLTQLGSTLQEAEELRRSHYDVINKIQSKKSPVEELVDQAEAVISRQNTSPRVYSAMTHSLTSAWESVNSHLQLRARLLDLNVNFHRWASEFEDCCDWTETQADLELPTSEEELRARLEEVRRGEREALGRLGRALAAGSDLLSALTALRDSATLDSRPGHVKLSAALAVAQVEKWMENLHERRSRLHDKTSKAIVQLEDCLELVCITAELTKLQKLLEERSSVLYNIIDQLGDTSASASLLLHEHLKLIPEAKEIQEHALKIVRTSEEFARRGHFAGPEAVAQAYIVLENSAEYIYGIKNREESLERVIAFFTSGEQALIKLDQLEVRLSTADLGLDPDHHRSLQDDVSKSVEDVTSPVLQDGYRILEETPTAQGVKRLVEQIENKKINLSVHCNAHKEETVRANAAYKIFTDKYNLLNAFITSMESYLSGVRDMGNDLISAKEFLQIYKRNLNDLQNKAAEIKALIASGRDVGGRKQTEIADSCLDLESRWCSLAGQLESRVSLANFYVRALSLVQNLNLQLDIIADVIRLNDNESRAETAWVSARQLRVQLENTASNFHHDSLKESGLESAAARECLERERQSAERRFHQLESDWEEFTRRRRELEVKSREVWENTMAASNKTVDWVSRLYDQLYPVLNPELHSARQLIGHVEEKLNAVLPEIKRALAEIQLRQETAQALLSKSDFRDANESITERLRDLGTRLNAISADYQVLLEKMSTFFNNLSQIENFVERGQREEVTCLPDFTGTVENLRRSLEADRKSVSAMFDLCHAECALLVERIKAQEGPKGDSDIRTIETSVESLRYSWQRLLTNKETKLLQLEKRASFDLNLKEIEKSLEGLSAKLLSTRGYGESLSEALSSSRDFEAFERTIQLLEVKINDFIQNGQDLVGREGSADIERDLAAIQQRWNEIKGQVKKAREKIELTIQLYTLVQEAEDWFREGNRLLTTIVHRSTLVKTYKEVISLLHELENYFKPGEIKQNQRIAEISRLADQLYGELQPPPSLQQVKAENKEMFDSFSLLSSQLTAISNKLRSPSPQPIIQFMDVDGSSSPHNVIHSTTIIKEYSSTVIEKTVREGLTPSPGLRIEEIRKTPSPPPKKVKITEEVAPSFTVPLVNANVNEGSSFCFTCKVVGKPAPQVRWEKDGVMIDEKNSDYKISTSDDGDCSLRIDETFTEDSARFSCIATNPAGSALTTAILSVIECLPENVPSPPEFIKLLKSSSFFEGNTMELKCSVIGVPLPTVQWFHGKTCIDNDPNYSIIYNNGEALVTKTGAFQNDVGEYSCVATNVAGTATSTALVTIKCKSPSPIVCLPKFVGELSNVMARAGQKVRLDCCVSGAERLDWTHDGRIVEDTPILKLVQEGNNASLIINEAYPKDAGIYCVKASNKGGSVISTATLTVKGRLPEESSDTEVAEGMEPARPVVQVPLKDLSVFEGKKVRLDCVIVAHPEPEVIWYHNEMPVKESTEIKLLFHGDRCSLIIEEALVEDSGSYRVVAINSAGEASSQCNLNITAVDKKAEPKPVPESEVVEGKPTFKKLLTDTLVKVGETVSLECVVEGNPMPTVTWALNNNELQQSDRIHMSQDSEGGCSLKIKEVKEADRGVYTAKATNQLGEAKCFSHLIVKSPVTLESLEQQAAPSLGSSAEERPSFTELFSDLVVAEGSPAKFECIVSGKPTPKIRWLYNEEPVSGKDFLVSTSGPRQVLTIPEAKKTLSGSITCSAVNSLGKANCTAKLLVTDSNKVLDEIFETAKLSDGAFEMKRAVFVESSSTSHFSTSSSSTSAGGSKPHVEVKSFSSKSEATSQKVGEKPPVSVEVHKTSGYTNIDGLESREESSTVKRSGGLDKVEVKTGLEKSSSGLIISKRKEIAPQFRTPLTGCIVDQDRPIYLEAIIDGHPSPEITWTRNGGPLPADAQVSWSLGKATLRIPTSETHHGGRYSLTAVNSAGSATSTADVVVKKSSFPPVMGHRLQAKTPVVGERLALEIEVTGTPVPLVSWSKDGTPINAATLGYRLISQGHSHSLVVDKVDHSHSGRYCAKATNSAGEATSMADVLVVDPPPPTTTTDTSSFFTDLMMENSSQFKSVVPGPTQTHITTFKRPGESVVVEESFQSQKQVSMKVHHSEESFDSSLEIKKEFGNIEFPKHSEISKTFESKKTVESVKVPEVRKVEPPKPKEEPVKIPEPIYQEPPKNEDLITDSISTKSSLDFFKNIIKENEEENRRLAAEPRSDAIKQPKFEPIKQPKFEPVQQPKFEPIQQPKFEPIKQPKIEPFKFEPLKMPAPLPPEEIKVSKEISSFSQSHSENYSSFQQGFTSGLGEFNLEPGPPPEIGFIPKSAVTKPKEEVVEKAKKLTEIHRQLSEVEAPSGGVRIFPVAPPVSETKKIESFEERREEKREIIKGPVLRPAAIDLPLRPESPRPSAEGVAMERLWTTKLDHKPAFDRPKSPLPSAEAVAMEKSWAHKMAESSLPSVWPPPEKQEKVVSSSESFSSQHIEVRNSFQTQTEKKSEASQPFVFQPKKIEPPQPEQRIIYVAEAHASHRTIPQETVMSQQSGLYETRHEESQVVNEKILLPSEAKKIWPPGPPVQPEPVPIRKPAKVETKPMSRSSSMPQGFDDIHLEPGPPPEIGFASPPSTERRQSYVEQIEQEIEKDLEKEPTRVLPGSVRTIPPPKRENSVESLKSYQRSSSTFEATSTKSTKSHKFSTVPRPSKFVKKGFESDYESDLEGTKIKARWTPWDSDTEEPTYRKVNPPVPLSQPPRARSVQPQPVSLPLFKPIAQPAPQKLVTFDGKRTPQDSGYMADTDEPRAIMKKSQFRSDKIFQSRQEKIIVKEDKKFDKKEEKIEKLESFSYNTTPQLQPKVSVPLPASPSKFVKGEFKESDYESDYDSKFQSVWKSSGEKVGFRPVHPPSTRPFSQPEPIFKPQPVELKPGSPPEIGFAPPIGVETSKTVDYSEKTGNTQKFVSVTQTTRVLGGSLDSRLSRKAERQTSLPTKFIPKGEAKWTDTTESKRLQRVEEMRQRFSERTSQSMVDLQPGEPPQYDYAPPIVPSSAASVVNKSLTEMSSSFKSKAQQFVSEVASDIKQNGKHAPILKSYQKDPEVYREESRVAQHGTKEIDPNTGLIYFKYDFGYEFGVVVPGEKGWVAGKKGKPSLHQHTDDGVPFPVIHESSKKKMVKWDSESETEVDPASGHLRVRIPSSPGTLSPAMSPYQHLAHHSPGAATWTSGRSSATSSPIVVNQMLHCQQPLKPPVFTTPLRDIAVVNGGSARFECIVEGHPQPTVTWSKAGQSELGPGWVPAFRNGVCRLDIPRAYLHHSGRYICSATNSQGRAETCCTLSVTGEERTFISS